MTHTLPEYASWKYVPHHLFDEAGLAELRLAPAGPAEGVLHHHRSGERQYLYNAFTAEPLPPEGDNPCRACGGAIERPDCAVCRRRRAFEQAYRDAERIVSAAREGRLYALDTETTGLDETAEVIELALVSQRDGPKLDTLVRPSTPIPPEAQGVHGITDEQVEGAPRWRDVAPKLTEAVGTEAVLVAWNAPFDARMLAQSSRAAGLTLPMPEVLCAMQAYAIITGARRNRISLKKAALELNLKAEGPAHRAVFDAGLTLAVIERLAQRF